MVLSQEHKHRELRKRLWNIVHHGRGMAGHAFNLFLIVFIIVSLSLLPLEFIPQLHEYHTTLAVIEVLTTVVFTIEYALRIYAAPNRAKFIFSFFGLIDLLSILPFYLGLLGTEYVRALRLVRAVRLLKIGELESGEDEKKERGIGLLPGEKVEYIITLHPIYLILGCLPPLLSTSCAVGILMVFEQHPVPITVAICLFLFAIVFFWKAWLDFSYDVIYVTTRRLICQNQFLIGRSINHVNYHTITNVIPYYPNIISFFLRFGSIKIETTSASLGHIELHTVRRHEHAAHMIMQKCYVVRKESDHKPGLHAQL